MNRGTGIFRFPGGVLELRAGDASEDCSGVYLELSEFVQDDDHESTRGSTEMHYRPPCLGYLRTDVSGAGQLWDQSQIRRLAERLGYDFADMVIYDPKFGRPPFARLKAQATRLDAEAVLVPSVEHFDGEEMPGVLVRELDVITVTPFRRTLRELAR
ncbi:hypothetical protein AB0L82_13730 [Nocardia sp. NPDC052001]|uniref:hypothetical protein n=1 Tax=Nocardia sp. NPDC052001 TaxID=3154853 RepID=UPI00343BE393